MSGDSLFSHVVSLASLNSILSVSANLLSVCRDIPSSEGSSEEKREINCLEASTLQTHMNSHRALLRAQGCLVHGNCPTGKQQYVLSHGLLRDNFKSLSGSLKQGTTHYSEKWPVLLREGTVEPIASSMA